MWRNRSQNNQQIIQNNKHASSKSLRILVGKTTNYM